MAEFSYSFAAPLEADAVAFLEGETYVPFRHLDTTDWLCVTARNGHGAVVGVLVLEPRNYFDWHMSCAIADQRLMTRRLLQAIFATAFTVGTRITAMVEPTNERALKQMIRLGFVYEGFCRLGIEGTRDACVFGMLRGDCRYLPGTRAAGTVKKIDIVGEAHGELTEGA